MQNHLLGRLMLDLNGISLSDEEKIIFQNKKKLEMELFSLIGI